MNPVRTLVIGDIHGCWAELQALFDKVGLNDGDRVVSVGDLVDRGPGSPEVVDWFRQRAGAVVVCGNHERKHVKSTMSHSQDITRLQFGPGARYADAVAWMSTLPYWWEDDQVVVVHAAAIPGEHPSQSAEDELCGTTSGSERLDKRLGGRWWHELYDGAKPVVYGHHVVGPEPLVRADGKTYGIDTGACHSMRLTGLLLPSFALVSVPAAADHWRQTRRDWQLAVLRQRPWGSMAFEQLERKARDLARGADPEAIAFLDQVTAWAAAVRRSIPALADAADGEIARLRAEHGDSGFARSAAAHPAGSTLLRRAAGKLSAEHLGCASPDAVLTLAERLGVTLDGLAPPGGAP